MIRRNSDEIRIMSEPQANLVGGLATFLLVWQELIFPAHSAGSFGSFLVSPPAKRVGRQEMNMHLLLTNRTSNIFTYYQY